MPTPLPAPTNLHLLSRNPIFTATKNVWGYEIQTTTGQSPSQFTLDQPSVGTAVIAGDYVGLHSILARNKKLLLAYTWDQLINQIPNALPATSSAILVNVDFQRDISLISTLKEMAASGHTIVLEWDETITPGAPALEFATHIYLDTPAQVTDVALATLMRAGLTCIARNVNTKNNFESLLPLGNMLFQGRYFKTAEIIPGKKLSTHQNSRLCIMRIIEAPDPDLNQLVQTIQSDVSLSYRLMTYLNSPSFGFMRKIDSIRQAMTLLGWNNLRSWLRAVLLADITQGEQQTELMHISLRRAKFLEQVVKNYDYWDFSHEELFLLGMFSLLDAILGISMSEAVTYLPLNDGQKKALQGDTTCEYAPLVLLMHAFEDDDPAVRIKAMSDLSIDKEKTEGMYYEASAWASSILEPAQTPDEKRR